MTGRHARYALAWAVALFLTADRVRTAAHAFDNRPPGQPDRHRPDGNDGHVQIDFGGQWVMGRLVATGRGGRLYDRNAQWEVMRESFPRAASSAWTARESFPHGPPPTLTGDVPRHDDDDLMAWFMGADSPRWADVGRAAALPLAAADPLSAAALLIVARERVTPELARDVGLKQVGGPLYPPVHGLLYAPLALLPPQSAYRVFTGLAVACTVLAAVGVSALTRGRVWFPVALAALLLYPGCRGGIELGQNPTVTLAVLVWGWALAARGRPGWGGVVWGLLAFKPVWGAAFFLLPLLQRRWRFCGAMALSGLGLAAATLPVVGLHGWLDWLAVGKEAADLYLVNTNWVTLSRDLFGLPRRALIDFTAPTGQRGNPAAAALGWLLWGIVFVPTAVLGWRAADRRPAGVTAGFIALGAYLCCYRFMYYDALLSAFGVALLFADWERFAGTPGPGWRGVVEWWADASTAVPVLLLAALLILENVLLRAEFEWPVGGRRIGTGYGYPWDTGLVLALWAWAGRRVWRGREEFTTEAQRAPRATEERQERK